MFTEGNRVQDRTIQVGSPKKTRPELASPRFQKAFSYIDSFRQQTTVSSPEDNKQTGAISLGDARFLVPNKERFGFLFYWDSYFMLSLHTPEGRNLARSTIQAFATLLDKFTFIPNAATNVFLDNSQAPLYSSMILDTYMSTPESEKDPSWLDHYMDYAKHEYEHVWNNKADYQEGSNGIGSFHHYFPEFGLSKYGDRDGDYSQNAERESGWDFTSRFGGVAVEYLPIDLNCFLYKYEIDFANAAEILHKPEERDMWLRKAKERKERINTYMWNEDKGFFFDYNYVQGKQSPFYSLAPYTALWSGLATPEQARKMLDQLPRFDRGKGLMVTDRDSLPPIPTNEQLAAIYPEHYQRRARITLGTREELTPEQLANEEITGKQWDYPHVWAPTEYLVVMGLLHYAKNPDLTQSERKLFRDKAKQLMEEYLAVAIDIFETAGDFPENSNGITGKPGNGAHYRRQWGFGWTNNVVDEFGQHLLPRVYEEEDKETFDYATITS